MALRYFIQADQLDKAQQAMDRLEAAAGTGRGGLGEADGDVPDDGPRPAGAARRARHRRQGRHPGSAQPKATAILGGFEKFLDGVAKRDPKTSSQIWVATTYLSLGSGRGTGSVVPKAKAEGYLAKAAEAYEKLLAKGGEEIAKFEPSIRLKMANVYRELGKWEEAQEQIDWILSDPKRQNSLDTQIQAAELLQAAGEKSADKAKAEQYLKQAIVGRQERGERRLGLGWDRQQAGPAGVRLSRREGDRGPGQVLHGPAQRRQVPAGPCGGRRAGARQAARRWRTTTSPSPTSSIPDLGGKAMDKQFDKLLKEIEKSRGEAGPKGLAGLKEAQPAATAQPGA